MGYFTILLRTFLNYLNDSKSPISDTNKKSMDLFNSEIKLWVPVSNISFVIGSVMIKEYRKKTEH